MAAGAGRAGKPFDYEINDETFELNDKEDSKLLENWEKMDTHELKEVSPATSQQIQSLSRVQMTTGHVLCCHLRCQCFRKRQSCAKCLLFDSSGAVWGLFLSAECLCHQLSGVQA